MKIGQAKALWKVPELWKNQKTVFPQLLGPSVHTSHNAGCCGPSSNTTFLLLPYVLTLENPEHFAKSRDVGPYLGLVPKQEDSGESQPQLGISKAGDTMVRKLLVGSAHYILGPFGPDSDLRSYGLRLCERGGKNAKKRAAVAVARKLAVLLHRLWVSGEVYEPLGYASSRAIVQQAAA